MWIALAAVKVRAERFYQKIRQEEGLKAEEYGQFEKFFWHFPDYNFELSVARRYVMPAKSSGDGTFDGLSVKILYREELEQMLCAGGEIFFGEDAFINISIYGKDGYYYTCGGGI